jgi:hypothetical protein
MLKTCEHWSTKQGDVHRPQAPWHNPARHAGFSNDTEQNLQRTQWAAKGGQGHIISGMIIFYVKGIKGTWLSYLWKKKIKLISYSLPVNNKIKQLIEFLLFYMLSNWTFNVEAELTLEIPINEDDSGRSGNCNKKFHIKQDNPRWIRNGNNSGT